MDDLDDKNNVINRVIKYEYVKKDKVGNSMCV